MAHVEAVCISEKKGIVKREQHEVVFKPDWGIENDAHAGKWHRQVSLLAGESIDNVKEKLPTLKNGAFAENIVTRGIDLTSLQIGDRLRVGESVTLEITLTGDCIMPREGLFAIVIAGGTISASDSIENVKKPTGSSAK